MPNTTPLPPEITQYLPRLTPLQLAWLSGYAWSQAQRGEEGGQNLPPISTALSAVPTAEPLTVTVLSASQTGNAKGVADKLAEKLNAAGVSVKRSALKDYKSKNIADEKLLLLVTSTQGEGEPPEEAVVLYKLLNGKKAPKLDFASTADKWVNDVVAIVKEKAVQQATPSATTQPSNAPAPAKENQYNKEKPYAATLLTNQKITGRQSDKDVRHIELDLSGSGLHYQVGDALGVWFNNDPALVKEILQLTQIEENESVTLNEKTLPISTALLSHLELTQNTPNFVKAYAELTKNKTLDKWVADSTKLQEYVQTTPIVDVLHDFPAKLTAQQLADLLRPLTPRLYSISSSPAEVGEEVHLTVGIVRFEHDGRARAGAASSYLAERVEEDEQVRVFVEHNDNFRLPTDSSKPIIMVGSGTGVAPFRAFVQQRAADEAKGKNWLIFGNQHFATDFLYQTEWQQFAKDGFLHKYDFAWSRDQEKKIYVQDKIREEASAIWQWLQEGAYFYVCGDAAKMAKDVEMALLEVIAQEGKLSADDAEDYLNELRENQRYQRDVY